MDASHQEAPSAKRRRTGSATNGTGASKDGELGAAEFSDENTDMKITFKSGAARGRARPGSECPYMHTINKKAMDFDFEKVCSVSLESHNVYACLVCGKFFQGRGPTSHAFAHAISADHHLFMNLATEVVYCLPEGYSVTDPALDAIAKALRPKFNRSDIERLDLTPNTYLSLDGEKHLQGITGLDNLHASDYANVIFQLILVAKPIRNFLLLARDSVVWPAGPPSSAGGRVLRELAILAQKLWSPSLFRRHISPNEVMKEIAIASEQRFSALEQRDPAAFLAWLINLLRKEVGRLCKRAAPGSWLRTQESIVQSCFQGTLEVSVRTTQSGNDQVEPQQAKFWYLALDLPPKPLFKDASERTLVPQVPLLTLMRKYDGVSESHVVETAARKSYRLLDLPDYLLLTINRVTRSNFATEKNPAIVHCPITGFTLDDLCNLTGHARGSRYDLVSVVTHEGPHEGGSYKVSLRHDAAQTWFTIDNSVGYATLAKLVALDETCILLYERSSRARDTDPDAAMLRKAPTEKQATERA